LNRIPLALAAAFLGAGIALPSTGTSGESAVQLPGRTAGVELAKATIARMGGEEAWRRTRYLQWDFGGRRQHVWDRRTGRTRMESEERLVLMNVRSREGRAWDKAENGLVEITDPGALTEALELGYAWWVNDSYWLIMPFKLLDPGANLQLVGPDELPDGRPADVLELTFDEGIGLTPQNKYRVWIAEDNGLVEQWSYYRAAEDEEPVFTRPWTGWERFGEVLIATDHGTDDDWKIAAPEELPDSVFEQP